MLRIYATQELMILDLPFRVYKLLNNAANWLQYVTSPVNTHALVESALNGNSLLTSFAASHADAAEESGSHRETLRCRRAEGTKHSSRGRIVYRVIGTITWQNACSQSDVRETNSAALANRYSDTCKLRTFPSTTQ